MFFSLFYEYWKVALVAPILVDFPEPDFHSDSVCKEVELETVGWWS